VVVNRRAGEGKVGGGEGIGASTSAQLQWAAFYRGAAKRKQGRSGVEAAAVAAGRCIAIPPRVRTTDCVLAQKISLASAVVGTKICCIWRSL
jgi:hypothetical protein